MRIKYIVFAFVFFCFFWNSVVAQETPSDTARVYRSIETYSNKSKFTRFIYSLFFKPGPTLPTRGTAKKKKLKKPLVASMIHFEGKTIRRINIETLDPFGYSITDTLTHRQNFFYRGGNWLHVKSQRITIRNLLLIRPSQVFDSLLLKESLRLIRGSGYVQEVGCSVSETSNNSDSVDISLRVLDKWTIIPKAAVSASRNAAELYDKNFLGLGHKARIGFESFASSPDYAYKVGYTIPNFRNTYINTTLDYTHDEYRNYTRSIAIDRPFFSPFAKWAVGAGYSQKFAIDSTFTSDLVYEKHQSKFNTQDYWAGNAFQLFKGRSEVVRTTNFISTVRYMQIHYLEKSLNGMDVLPLYPNENLTLASIGISTRRYVQDNYIYEYGATEDVPVGKVYSLTGGIDRKGTSRRTYAGARFALGNYHPWGYLSSTVEYGTFFRGSNTEQGVLSVNVLYFTELVEIGKWKFRQFAKPQFTIGFNRTLSDSLTLKDGLGLNGFKSSALSGTSRILFSLQIQSYAPWNILGFHFGPYLVYSAGMLGDERKGFNRSRIYSQIGLGVLIKNENLVFSTFQMSVVFYPLIPGNGQDVFKINSFKSTDFGFRDFEIGKPDVLAFR